jgi:hypothetical protein
VSSHRLMGVYGTVVFHEALGKKQDEMEVYISFGRQVFIDGDADPIGDEFGIKDDRIFYFGDQPEELVWMFSPQWMDEQGWQLLAVHHAHWKPE